MHPAVSTSPAQIQVSVAAAVASGARWPVGTMAAGWIAPFTRQRDVRASVERLACVWLGLGLVADGVHYFWRKMIPCVS